MYNFSEQTLLLVYKKTWDFVELTACKMAKTSYFNCCLKNYAVSITGRYLLQSWSTYGKPICFSLCICEHLQRGERSVETLRSAFNLFCFS